MHGATVAKMPLPKIASGSKILVTPELATRLLQANQLNRPLAEGHAERIAGQIREGKWRFNGDTIKIATGGDILDGQHRLWAIIESDTPVESMIVTDIARDAFSTIDTIRKPRSLGDTVALTGNVRYRNTIGGALAWLTRWQAGCLENYKAPKHRVENSDIESALAENPGIIRAAERAHAIRNIANTSVMAFLYYIVVNRNEPLAERMMATLLDPAGVSVNDPFFKLRSYFVSDHHKRKDPVVTIAVAIKAINAVNAGQKINVLNWRQQGKSPEVFPKLNIARAAA